MKRFIRSFFLFIVSALIIYLLLLIIGGNLAPKALRNIYYPIGFNHMFTKMKEARKAKNVDIVFMGSSHAERGFDPRIFASYGYSSFNLGTSAQTPIQTEMLINRYLDNLQPKIIIYDVYPAVFTIDGVEAALRLVANDRNDKYSIEMALTINNMKLYNTLAYAFYRDFFNKNEHLDSSELIPSEGTYVFDGYTEKELLYFKHLHYDSSTWVYDQKQFDYFEKTIDKLKEKNIRVFLVQTPMTSAYYSSYTNNKEFDKYMASKGDYFNFNNQPLLDDSLHFYDYDHLNQRGVAIYDSILIKTLFDAGNDD